MSLVTMFDAIVAGVRDEFSKATVKTVLPYDGQFGEADINQFAVQVPAVFVSCGGFNDTEDQGDDIVAPGQWVATIVTQRTQGGDAETSRIRSAMAIAEALTKLIRDSNAEGGAWADESAGAPSKIRARNINSEDLTRVGVTMWLVTWEQDASVEPFDPALDDLLRMESTFDDGSVTGVVDVITTTVAGAA